MGERGDRPSKRPPSEGAGAAEWKDDADPDRMPPVLVVCAKADEKGYVPVEIDAEERAKFGRIEVSPCR